MPRLTTLHQPLSTKTSRIALKPLPQTLAPNPCPVTPHANNKLSVPAPNCRILGTISQNKNTNTPNNTTSKPNPPQFLSNPTYNPNSSPTRPRHCARLLNPYRLKSPLLPPLLESSLISLITIVLSIAFTMS